MSESNAVFLICERQAQRRCDGTRAIDVEADRLARVGDVRRGEVLHRRVLDVHAVDQGAGREQAWSGWSATGPKRTASRGRGDAAGADGLWATALPARTATQRRPQGNGSQAER